LEEGSGDPREQIRRRALDHHIGKRLEIINIDHGYVHPHGPERLLSVFAVTS
jgi:hypothetical protein